MAWTAKFLVPFRQSFSQSRHLFNGKIRPLKTWVHIFEPKLQSRASKFEYMLNIQRKYVQDCCFSGSRHMRSIFGASVMLGAVYCWSHISHAMDGLDIFSDDNHLESFDASEVITRILLFLLSTKPSPSSIYLFIEKLCYGYMRQKPHFYKCTACQQSRSPGLQAFLPCYCRNWGREDTFDRNSWRLVVIAIITGSLFPCSGAVL
ncbi:hypothetical protein ERO13_A10G102700v2 [Gossypium hirsutum]|uniref:Uncharacterized protein isoform X5 n=1 Tax=Gossypium hirsutum TaxID=3635 RepID=A0ABM2YZW0_GOSHI|nr:uncharacterized protein LOC107897566 isoform X5 [Gossypium hirsutum]KAG4179364.1 hypothetical protein ERO13_A10G102700v2 [Gossypium hirsutum]